MISRALFSLKISKMNQRKQTILVIFYMSESVPLITFSQNLSLQEAIESATKINEELKRMEFDDAVCRKIIKPLIDITSLFRLTWKIDRENDTSKEK